MVYQFDPELGPFIKEWGCYFCCILKVAEEQRGKKIGGVEARSIYLAAMMTNIVQKEVYDKVTGLPKDGVTVEKPEELLVLAGGKGKIRKVDGALYRATPDEFQILKFYNPATKYSHFVVGDGMGKVTWDPLENSNTVAHGFIIEQRIVLNNGSF